MTDESWHMYIGFICGVLLTTIYFMLAAPAHGTAVCLSLREARVLWPTRHVWWFRNKQTGERCWSNRRGGPPRNLRYDLIRENHAQSLTAQPYEKPATETAVKGDRAPIDASQPSRGTARPHNVVKIVRAEDFNELDAAADQDTFFNAKPFPYQGYVLNLDRYSGTFWHRQIWGLAKETK